jgi:hypothetical protein
MQTPYHEPDDGCPPNDPGSLPGPRHRPALRLARRMWDPAPVAKPMIDPDLDQLSWPERCAEVVRHALLSIEHWLSGGGWLREWIRLNLWLAVVLIAATVLVIPPVTALLEGVRDWTALISATVGNVNTAVATLPSIVLALATGFLVVKLIQRHRTKRRPSRHHAYDNYE